MKDIEEKDLDQEDVVNDEENQEIWDEDRSIPDFSMDDELGPDWPEYFTRPGTFQNIIENIGINDFIKSKSEGNPEATYEFISILSALRMNEVRFSVKVLFRSLKTGTEERWIIDIAKHAPSWEQILDILYGEGQDCVGRVLIFPDNLLSPRSPDAEIEYRALFWFIMKVLSNKQHVYVMHLNSEDDENGEKGIGFIPFVMLLNRRRMIPPQMKLESLMWREYYESYMGRFDHYKSLLVTDKYISYIRIPFLVTPEWTEKGTFMKIYGMYDCPENTWFMQNCKEEIMKLYPGCKVKLHVKSKIPCIMDIRLDRIPVWDFVEASSDYKLKYAEDVRDRQMALIHQIEDIFRNYKPDEPVD